MHDKTVGFLMQVDDEYTNADGTQVAPRNLNPGGSAYTIHEFLSMNVTILFRLKFYHATCSSPVTEYARQQGCPFRHLEDHVGARVASSCINASCRG